MVTRTITAANREGDIESLGRLLEAFLPGRKLTVTVEEAKVERSDLQRRGLFGCAYKALMAQMGLAGESEKNDLHEFLCGDFWGWREKNIMGQIHRYPIRTTTRGEDGKRDVISVREQLDFYAWIQRRAAENGYDVPDPDKEWFRKAERDAELEALAEAV